MLFTLSFWQLLIIFGAGLLMGFILFALIRHKISPPDEEIDHSSAEQQLKKYRFSVHQHLTQTSELIHQLGQDYERLNEQLLHDMHTLDGKQHMVSSYKKHTHIEPKLDTMPKTYVDPDEKKHHF